MRTRKGIVIFTSDKGCGVVILDRDIYDTKLLETINDTAKLMAFLMAFLFDKLFLPKALIITILLYFSVNFLIQLSQKKHYAKGSFNF